MKPKAFFGLRYRLIQPTKNGQDIALNQHNILILFTHFLHHLEILTSYQHPNQLYIYPG
ncbi:hypothetical protein NIES19_33180 [Anabaena cylindrica PCC 7122]|nr:hypothetical protein NIES19_33180 [Anabaena cylindrica PCC 7122]